MKTNDYLQPQYYENLHYQSGRYHRFQKKSYEFDYIIRKESLLFAQEKNCLTDEFEITEYYQFENESVQHAGFMIYEITPVNNGLKRILKIAFSAFTAGLPFVYGLNCLPGYYPIPIDNKNFG